MVLEDDGALGAGCVDLPVFQEHRASRDRGQTGDQVKQGRLAAAGMADDRDKFTLADDEVDTLQHLGPLAAAFEIFVDVIKLEIGAGHHAFLSWPWRRA